MNWRLPALILLAATAWAQTAAELGGQLRELALDPDECYRVHDLNLAREDLKFYFTDGYLIFAKPVAGRTVAAVFSAENEGGDAEVLVLPPNPGERMSLAAFTGSPNLNEHFRSGLLLFADGAGEELKARIREGAVRRSKDRGLLLADNWRSVLRNLAASFQVRLVRDLLSGEYRQEGMFFAALSGVQHGNFDLIYDPLSSEQITLGQVVYQQERAFFNTWTGFQARAFRNGQRKSNPSHVKMNDFRIDVNIDPKLKVSAVTRAHLTAQAAGQRAVLIELSRRMTIESATVNGEKAEIFERESMRSDLLRHDLNRTLVLVMPRPLEAGRSYDVEIRHGGEVIVDAGNGVYFVGARGGWYPRMGADYSTFDLTFRYPKDLSLVATGEVAEETVEGEQRRTRVRSTVPVRLAGFNLGHFEKSVVTRGGYTVEINANRFFERALERTRPAPLVPMNPPSRRIPQVLVPGVSAPVQVHPGRLEHITAEIAEAYEEMASRLGAPPLRKLTGAPIPGSFGQGYPGLLFLSTLFYLNPEDRPAEARRSPDVVLFLDLLGPHETAHQWWGNLVAASTYHDEWLMEALANYQALLHMEKRRGTRFIDSVLERYRTHLLEKTSAGGTTESIGPITWGTRLETAAAPDAWRIITYEKGTWILHMLRRRMGDERFHSMLGELMKKYRLRTLATEDLREEAKAWLPARTPDASLESFFDTWVYGTGIPALKMECTIHGKAGTYQVAGTLTQSEVGDEFSTPVPVEIQFAKGPAITQWVLTAPGAVKFQVKTPRRPVRVVLDPQNSVLAVKH